MVAGEQNNALPWKSRLCSEPAAAAGLCFLASLLGISNLPGALQDKVPVWGGETEHNLPQEKLNIYSSVSDKTKRISYVSPV